MIIGSSRMLFDVRGLREFARAMRAVSALTAINEGQIWIDNGSVKALFHDARDISQEGNINHITGRQQEIIECVCQGLSNNEIARKLTLSPHTVKAHLNTIFKKCNVTSRSKLMTLSLHSRQAASA